MGAGMNDLEDAMRFARMTTAVLVMFALVSLVALAPGLGCNTRSEQDQTIRILWADWQPADALAELGRAYEMATGIPVVVVKKSWAGDFLNTTLNEFRNNGDKYDIIIGDSQWLGMGVQGNHYVELTDWIPENIDVDAIAPAAWKWYCEYPKDSKRYFAVPCEADAMAWCYRKDLFEDPKHQEGFAAFLKEQGVSEAFELAPPRTWEQLRLIGQYFKDKTGINGLVMPTSRDYDMATMSFQQVMWAFGGEYGDYATNQVKIDSPQTAEALRFFTKLMNATSAGGRNMTFDEVGPAYYTGNAAMACNFLAFFPAISSNPDYGSRTGYFNMPAGPGGLRFATLGGQGMSINAHINPERQQRAKDFLKWFSTKEVQYKWAEKGGFTSDLEVMRSDTFKAAAPYNPLFEEAFGIMNDFWAVPEFDQLMKVCQREFCSVFQGGADPVTAVQNIAREHEAILRKGGHIKDKVTSTR
jgi:multiple sugar transport system substrate-binding protein